MLKEWPPQAKAPDANSVARNKLAPQAKAPPINHVVGRVVQEWPPQAKAPNVIP